MESGDSASAGFNRHSAQLPGYMSAQCISANSEYVEKSSLCLIYLFFVVTVLCLRSDWVSVLVLVIVLK